MKRIIFSALFILIVIVAFQYAKIENVNAVQSVKHKVIFDTDANNELDDQHALAYLLFNGKHFFVTGITVNATYNGGNIDEQYKEAERVMHLCAASNRIPLLRGTNGKFEKISGTINEKQFDGYAGVNFIIDEAKKVSHEKLVVLAVGKLTNVALALLKEPAIAEKIRLVWLGSNYPEPGEYNQDNDTTALNYLLNSNMHFEMVTVRYGKQSGTDAVRVTPSEIKRKMAGMGPRVAAIAGRHGGTFETFGAYSISLFENTTLHGNPPARALFDMAAVAIVKNPKWGSVVKTPAPILIDNKWIERPDNTRMIYVWENFDQDTILKDFFRVMKNYDLVK